jgi:hypothetical protein
VLEITPDVTAWFDQVQVTDLGADRVRASGAAGVPPPATLKVSVGYRGGLPL